MKNDEFTKKHEGHHVKNQGHAVWDFLTTVDEGTQYFCEECQLVWLVLDTSRKIDVDPDLVKRVENAFNEVYEKMGPL
jgi:hypothetical protein